MKSAALYFSEEMDMDSVASHVEVQPAIAFSTNPGLSTFYLNFMEHFDYAQTYQIIVRSGTSDLEGDTLLSDATYTFRTKPQGPPEIIGSFPDEGDVFRRLPLSARIMFSEAMSYSSVLNHLSLTPAWAFSSWTGRDGDGNYFLHMKPIPVDSLEYDADYVITLAAGAEDLEGEALQSDHTINFHTQPINISVTMHFYSEGGQYMSEPSLQEEILIDPPITSTFQSTDDWGYDMVFDGLLVPNETYTVTIQEQIYPYPYQPF